MELFEGGGDAVDEDAGVRGSCGSVFGDEGRRDVVVFVERQLRDGEDEEEQSPVFNRIDGAVNLS